MEQKLTTFQSFRWGLLHRSGRNQVILAPEIDWHTTDERNVGPSRQRRVELVGAREFECLVKHRHGCVQRQQQRLRSRCLTG